MKNIIKKLKNNSLFTFILGILVCSGVVYGVNLYNANDIEYTKVDGTKTNVNEALNDLYANCGSSSNKVQLKLENKVYNAGESITWSGLDWYAITDNSDSVTMILKGNYSTGVFGSSTTFTGSTAYNQLNDTFVNSNMYIKEAIDGGVLVSQGDYNNEPYYVRLPIQSELSTTIPNSSSTPFWTMTVNGSGLYFGNNNGAEGTKYSGGGSTLCYQGRQTNPEHLRVTYTNSVKTSSALEPGASSVITGYSTGKVWCGSSYFKGKCGSSGEPESYCTSTGVSGCGWSTSDYGGDGNSCSQRTTYYLSSAQVVGYRPVVTVYKK